MAVLGDQERHALTTVVLPVYDRYLPGASVRVAATNAAARLIGGTTMHQLAALTRNQTLTCGKPGAAALDRLKRSWGHISVVFADEIGQTNPELLATLSWRCAWGRLHLTERAGRLSQCVTTGSVGSRKQWSSFPGSSQAFRDVPVQLSSGDFKQLNPVRSHTLLETFLEGTGLTFPGVPKETSDAAQAGLAAFRELTHDVVLFSGSH